MHLRHRLVRLILGFVAVASVAVGVTTGPALVASPVAVASASPSGGYHPDTDPYNDRSSLNCHFDQLEWHVSTWDPASNRMIDIKSCKKEPERLIATVHGKTDCSNPWKFWLWIECAKEKN